MLQRDIQQHDEITMQDKEKANTLSDIRHRELSGPVSKSKVTPFAFGRTRNNKRGLSFLDPTLSESKKKKSAAHAMSPRELVFRPEESPGLVPSSTLSSSSDSQPFGVTGGKDSDEKEAPPSSTGALDVGSISKETPLTRELISSVTVSSLKTPPSSYNFTSSTRENDEDGHVSLDGQHIDGIEGESPAQPLAPSQSEQPGVSRVCYSANASVRGEQQNSADKLSSTCVSSTVVDGSTRHHDTRSNPTASPAREGVDVEAARPCAPLAHAQIYQHTDASFEEQNSTSPRYSCNKATRIDARACRDQYENLLQQLSGQVQVMLNDIEQRMSDAISLLRSEQQQHVESMRTSGTNRILKLEKKQQKSDHREDTLAEIQSNF